MTLKGMYFQLVDKQVLSTRGQADVNLHRPAAGSSSIGKGGQLAAAETVSESMLRTGELARQ